MNVWVVSPGSGVGVFVGVLVDVTVGDGVRVMVFVIVGLDASASNGLAHALSSEIMTKKIIIEAMERFIAVYCTLSCA